MLGCDKNPNIKTNDLYEEKLVNFLKGDSYLKNKTYVTFLFERIFNSKIPNNTEREIKRNMLLKSAEMDLFFTLTSKKYKCINSSSYYDGKSFYTMNNEELNDIETIFTDLDAAEKFFFLDAKILDSKYEFQAPANIFGLSIFNFIKNRLNIEIEPTNENIGARNFYRLLTITELKKYADTFPVSQIAITFGKYKHQFAYDLPCKVLENIIKSKKFNDAPNIVKFSLFDALIMSCN